MAGVDFGLFIILTSALLSQNSVNFLPNKYKWFLPNAYLIAKHSLSIWEYFISVGVSDFDAYATARVLFLPGVFCNNIVEMPTRLASQYTIVSFVVVVKIRDVRSF